MRRRELIGAKRLELLRELVPKGTMIALTLSSSRTTGTA
jgi:hypothetical protein